MQGGAGCGGPRPQKKRKRTKNTTNIQNDKNKIKMQKVWLLTFISNKIGFERLRNLISGYLWGHFHFNQGRRRL